MLLDKKKMSKGDDLGSIGLFQSKRSKGEHVKRGGENNGQVGRESPCSNSVVCVIVCMNE